MLARRRLQGVLHLRQRSTSPRRRLSPKHGSWTKWRPGVCPSPIGGPNHLDFASCRRSRLPSPLFPWVAWRQQSWRLTQSQLCIVTPPANPGSPEPRIWRPSPARLLPSFAAGPSKKEPLEEATREHLSSGSANAEVVASTPQATQPRSPPTGTSPHAASTAAAQGSAQEGKPPVVLSPTSPAEPGTEGGGAVASTPPVATPTVPVGTHLIVLRMAMTANNTIMSLSIVKGKDALCQLPKKVVMSLSIVKGKDALCQLPKKVVMLERSAEPCAKPCPRPFPLPFKGWHCQLLSGRHEPGVGTASTCHADVSQARIIVHHLIRKRYVKRSFTGAITPEDLLCVGFLVSGLVLAISLEQEPRSLEQLQPTWSLASWGPVELHTLALAFEYT
eukprot:s6743_g4.t1